MAQHKQPSVRQLRVGEELRHALAEVLGRGELRDPELRGRAITVTEVRASPDLKRATALPIPGYPPFLPRRTRGCFFFFPDWALRRLCFF